MIQIVISISGYDNSFHLVLRTTWNSTISFKFDGRYHVLREIVIERHFGIFVVRVRLTFKGFLLRLNTKAWKKPSRQENPKTKWKERSKCWEWKANTKESSSAEKMGFQRLHESHLAKHLTKTCSFLRLQSPWSNINIPAKLDTEIRSLVFCLVTQRFQHTQGKRVLGEAGLSCCSTACRRSWVHLRSVSGRTPIVTNGHNSQTFAIDSYDSYSGPIMMGI